MSKKLKYTAPAILEDLALELEAEILGASAELKVDESIDKVETMGQEIGGTVDATQWTQEWQ
jgi:hypothetical protein